MGASGSRGTFIVGALALTLYTLIILKYFAPEKDPIPYSVFDSKSRSSASDMQDLDDDVDLDIIGTSSLNRHNRFNSDFDKKSPNESTYNIKPETLPDYAQEILRNAKYPFIPLEPERKRDIQDSFSDYKYRHICNISSLDMHLPFTPLCSNKQELLDALTNGGRFGFDQPFKPLGCDMRWYTTEEICDILSSFERVALLGDSMIRHLFAAMNVMLRQDLGYGAVSSWSFNDEEKELCFCNNQVNVKSCSWQTVGDLDAIRENDPLSLKCGPEVHAFQGVIVRYPITDDELKQLKEDLRPLGTGKPTALVYGHGLWNSLDIDSTLDWIDQIEEMIHFNLPHMFDEDGELTRLFVAPPACGILKEDEWIPTQGNKRIMEFEYAMKDLLPYLDIDVLGTWNSTIQASSYDGSHQDLRANLLKAQMVLNWLDMVRQGSSKKSNEEDMEEYDEVVEDD